MKKSLLFILVSILVSVSSSEAVLLDFNGGASTDWTDQFTGSSSGSVLNTNWAWSSTSGIGATGALTSTTNPSLVYETATVGNSINVSASFFYVAGTPAAGSGYLHLGFADRATSNVTYTGNAIAEMFGIRLEGPSPASANKLAWRVRADTVAGAGANAAITNQVDGADMTFSGNNWYQVSATYTKSATAGVWDFSASVNNLGSDGLQTPSLLGSIGGSFTQTATYNQAETTGLYGAFTFRNEGTASRFNQLDNLNISAIPEPATVGLLTAGLMALLLRRRRSTY